MGLFGSESENVEKAILKVQSAMALAQGLEGFMQGIFVQYGITVDDEASAVRNGGFGSTTK
jgi:dUTP pyrophosphatase